jgi:DNA-directed RNA polymerase specialized sigma24 family protein
MSHPSTHSADAALVQALLARDPQAWQQLYDEHFGLLVNYARGRLGQRQQAAEEAVTDVLALLCFRNLRPLLAYDSRRGSLHSYLLFLTRQAVQIAYRKRQRRQRRETAVSLETLDEHCASETLSDAELEDALARLSAHQRAVFEFWYLGKGGAADRRPIPARVRKLKERFVACLQATREGEEAAMAG